MTISSIAYDARFINADCRLIKEKRKADHASRSLFDTFKTDTEISSQ
jgi:hypothetical protein